MKRVTATEARRRWFTLLDEAARGEVITIERNGKQIILQLIKTRKDVPDYRASIDFPGSDDADTWGWDWKAPGKLVSRRRRKAKR